MKRIFVEGHVPYCCPVEDTYITKETMGRLTKMYVRSGKTIQPGLFKMSMMCLVASRVAWFGGQF